MNPESPPLQRQPQPPSAALLPPALWLLIRLRAAGFFRRYFGRLGSVKGVLGLLIVLALLALWGLNAVFQSRAGLSSPDNLLTWGPLLGLAALLLTIALPNKSGGLVFLPAEVQLLFPGPFTRRQLVIYRLTIQFLRILALSPLFTLWARPWAMTTLGAWLAVLLISLALQYITVLVPILTRLRGGRALRAVAIAALGLIAFFLYTTYTRAGDVAAMTAELRAVRDMPAVAAALGPFTVFARILAAPTAAAVLQPAAIAVAIVAGLVALIIRADRLSLDEAVSRGERQARAIESVRSGRVAQVRSGSRASRRRVPMPRWLGPGAPIAWRQSTYAARSSLAWIVVAFPLVTFCLLWFLPPAAAVGALFPLIVTGWVFTRLLRFDFRSDLDTLPVLKSLPIGPTAVAVGELFTPVVMITATAWACLLVAATAYPASAGLLAAVALVVPIVVTLVVALENTAFLLYPTRQFAGGPADVQQMGRGVILFVVQAIALALLMLPVAVVGYAAVVLTGLVWAGAVVAAGVGVVECVLMVWAAGYAFERFDVARDTPP